MKSLRKAFITHKKYGRMKSLVYYPHNECDDINLEPIYLVRTMKKVQVEVLQNVEFYNGYEDKGYKKGIHSLDIDLAKLLVRCAAARFLLPHNEVLKAKQSNH